MSRDATVDACRMIPLQHIGDHRGSLLVAEAPKHLPFQAARMFAVRDVPAGETRGHHAHKQLNQFLICLAGKIRVDVDDAAKRIDFVLDATSDALLIPAGLWSEQVYETPEAILLVLCDLPYDEADYIRDYDAYKAYKQNSRMDK